MYEGFDYTVGDSIVGKTGGSGWGSNAWQVGGSLPAFTANVTSGLTFGSLSTTGGALTIASSGYANWNRSFVTRQIGTGTVTGSTLWTSYLFKADIAGGGLGNPSSGHEAGLLVSTSANSMTGARFQSMAKPTWNSDFAGVAYDGSVTSGTSGSLRDGSTYIVVSRFTNVGGTGGGTATLWALSQSQFGLISSGGVTEAELDSAFVTKISDTSTSSFSFATSHFMQFTARRKSGSESLAFVVDELRFGNTVSSVTPVN